MLIGASVVMTKLRESLDRIARTDFTVLIEGESGAGKELAARHLHAAGARNRGPFVAVNCAAIVETLVETELFGIEERTATGVRGRAGKFELAQGGTILLDEIGDLSLTAQAKLLRILQDAHVERVGGTGSRRVNTRIVAATNRPLAEMVREQRFRADLFYRLAGVEVHMPPLRHRLEDVPLLVRHLLDRHGPPGRWRLSASAMDAMRNFDWPGNVRQLERALERAVALAGSPVIGLEDLPDELARDYRQLVVADASADASLRAWSRRYARYVLDTCHGNRREACERLAISYRTLKCYIDRPEEARRSVKRRSSA